MTPLSSWGFLGVHAHLHIDLKKKKKNLRFQIVALWSTVT